MATAGFNSTYYVQTYPDVLIALSRGTTDVKTAEEHFEKYGAKEGRNPNANFDSTYYLANNPDVLNAVRAGTYASAYDHYIRNGGKEGRIPSAALANFNGTAYLAANADLAGKYTATNVLEHYVLYGAAEGRSGGTAQQVSGNYVGTTGDDTVTPAGGQASTVRVEGGQQKAGGDTLVVTSGSAASFQFMDLSNNADQNQTRDNSTGNNTGNKIGPVVQGFENVDASAATINMNLTALDRTSITNTDSAASTISGSKLTGGTGRDTLTGGAGADSLVGNDGNDNITGGAGNDTILGGVGDDNIGGGAGVDSINSGTGNDTVTGDAGNDTINVDGTGTKSIDGGADNDTINVTADQGSTTTVSTISGNSGNDTIVLNATAITAASRVSVSGGAGNDTITAGLGVETVNAGAGNDTVKFTSANLGSTDVFNGNDGQDFLQLEIPTGSGTNTYVLTPVNGQFAGFEGIELIDSSGNTNAKQYKIVLTDNFVANNLVSGAFLIDARGLPGGSNLVIDFSALTSASAALFAAGAFRVLASPSTDVRDQNNVTITNTYLTNTSNTALSATAAFNIFAGDTTVVAGARNADGTINTNGQTAYTTTGGTAETVSGTVSYNFTQTTSTAAVLTSSLNNGFGTGFLTTGADLINSSTFLAASTVIVDSTANDGDRLDMTLTANAAGATITNIETLNITSFGGTLGFGTVTGASSINISGTSFTGTGIANSSTFNLSNIFGAQSYTLATNTATDTLRLNLSNVNSGTTFTFSDSGAAAIETINLSLSNNATAAITSLTANGSTINVLGTGTFALTHNGGQNATFNASTLSGAFNYTQGAAADVSITGSAGNDTFAFGALLTTADTVNGGAGSDTLTVSAGAATNLDNVTGVETVTLAAGANYTFTISNNSAQDLDSTAVTINASALASTNTLTFDGSLTDQHGYTITGGAGNDTITGSGIADVINGGAGNDTVNKGVGADRITLGDGNDIVILTSAANTFGAGTAVITDFVAGTATSNDLIRLDLTNAGVINAGTTVAALAAGDAGDLTILATAQTTTQLATGAAGNAAANAVIVAFNSTTGKAELWYDTDWTDAANRVQIATLDNITTLVGVTGLSTTNAVDFDIV